MGKPNVNIVVGGPANVYPTEYKSKVLKPGIPFASQVTDPNMKYVIKYDFDLGGGDVTIPENCILEFDGGSLRNGTIVGNNTKIGSNSECFNNITFSGNFASGEILVEWFGAKNDGITDCSAAFEDAIAFASYIKTSKLPTDEDLSVVASATIKLNGGTYLVNDTIVLSSLVNINGNDATILANHSNLAVIQVPDSTNYRGTIKSVTIDGGNNRIDGISGCFYASFIENVAIRNCIKRGIVQTKGYELYISNVDIGIHNNTVLDSLDSFENIVGIQCLTSDGFIANVTIKNYPIGLDISTKSAWFVNNLHVWGAAYHGTYPRVGAVFNTRNFVSGIYIDSIDKSDPNASEIVEGEGNWLTPVKGIYNGGIGILLLNRLNVIKDIHVYNNSQPLANGSLIAIYDNSSSHAEQRNTIDTLVIPLGTKQYFDSRLIIDKNATTSAFNTGTDNDSMVERTWGSGYENAKINFFKSISPSSQEANSIASYFNCVKAGDIYFQAISQADGNALIRLYKKGSNTNFYIVTDGSNLRSTVPFSAPSFLLGNNVGLSVNEGNIVSNVPLKSPKHYIGDVEITQRLNTILEIGGPLRSIIPSDFNDRNTCFGISYENPNSTPYLVISTKINDEYRRYTSDGRIIGKMYGTYANKPAFVNNEKVVIGYMYFATDINKPIFWTGNTSVGDNGWVDANGNNPSQS